MPVAYPKIFHRLLPLSLTLWVHLIENDEKRKKRMPFTLRNELKKILILLKACIYPPFRGQYLVGGGRSDFPSGLFAL